MQQKVIPQEKLNPNLMSYFRDIMLVESNIILGMVTTSSPPCPIPSMEDVINITVEEGLVVNKKLRKMLQN